MDVSEPGVRRTQEDIGNYRIMTLQSDEQYEVLVQVENTVVRAYAKYEDSYMIREALMKTGYYYKN